MEGYGMVTFKQTSILIYRLIINHFFNFLDSYKHKLSACLSTRAIYSSYVVGYSELAIYKQACKKVMNLEYRRQIVVISFGILALMCTILKSSRSKIHKSPERIKDTQIFIEYRLQKLEDKMTQVI